jgi:DNA-binding transcriptional ArsR family regulator
MVRKQTQQYEAWAQIIKGMAHPTRLLLIDELLRWRERCVCDLTAAVGADMSTVSRHLLLLKQAGIVADEKRGQMVFYHLCTKHVKGFLKFIECCLRCS